MVMSNAAKNAKLFPLFSLFSSIKRRTFLKRMTCARARWKSSFMGGLWGPNLGRKLSVFYLSCFHSHFYESIFYSLMNIISFALDEIKPVPSFEFPPRAHKGRIVLRWKFPWELKDTAALVVPRLHPLESWLRGRICMIPAGSLKPARR